MQRHLGESRMDMGVGKRGPRSTGQEGKKVCVTKMAELYRNQKLGKGSKASSSMYWRGTG